MLRDLVAMTGGGSNEHLVKANTAFAAKHGNDGIPITLEGQKGTLFSNGAWLPYDPYSRLGGVDPPEDERKRRDLIIKYHETRVAMVEKQHRDLTTEWEQRIAVSERPGQFEEDVPEEVCKRLRELKELHGKYMAELEPIRKELEDEKKAQMAQEAEWHEERERRRQLNYERLHEFKL